jgi:methane/ammonia monooxygenase subunit B
MKPVRRVVVAAVLGVVLGASALTPGRASAHGEGTQAPWVRTLTATFFDLDYSGGSRNQRDDVVINVGERARLSGRVQLSTQWPVALGEPRIGYLGVNMPGPVLAVLDKRVNGEFAPGSIATNPGDSFQFELELAGRRPGRWHLHPRFDIEGQGPLLGPGQWVTVRDQGEPYRSPVRLATGKEIDLERFGFGHVAGWHLFWLLGGLLFAGHFLRRGLFRQFVAVREGRHAAGATTRGDRLFAVVVGALVLGLIVVTPGLVKPKDTLPLQVLRDRLPPLELPPLVAMRVDSIRYNPSAESVVVTADVKNTGASPLAVEQVVIGPLAFRAPQFGGRGDAQLTVAPDIPIAPGGTERIRLTLSDRSLRQERLTLADQTISRFGGLVIVRNSQGERSWQSVAGDLVRYDG